MSYATAAFHDASKVIVLAIGRRSPTADAAPDTLLFVIGDPERRESSDSIAEHVHEIGAMAVVA